ncbi:MAG: hypothetical protein IPG80_09360 [Anaerolineales bacterium]|uniref:hypothetical protein n=1 Tax=Candidatus Villigracilis vicinus TaxID=3140679 RepID=UPI003134946C|nr:hypothetical protein [Anaerolineales bacterium]
MHWRFCAGTDRAHGDCFSAQWLACLRIGAISDLSYSYRGFWISFDLSTGVVISSAAFPLWQECILGIKEFQPMPSLVLTALLG